MFRPLKLAAIKSSTYKKYAEEFIMIYHHNRNYDHHVCKDLNLVAVPVSTLQSRCLSNGRPVFPFPAGWYFITACACLVLPIILTRCIHLLWRLLTCVPKLAVFLIYFKIPLFVLWSNSVYFAVFLNNVISTAVIRDLSCSFSANFRCRIIRWILLMG